MFHRIAQCTAVAVTAAVAFVGLGSTAHAAPGDPWTGQQVVDVVPAATTQTMVLASATRIDQPGKDPYQWNNVKMVRDKDGRAAWVFCIQASEAANGLDFTEDPDKAGTPEARANADHINRILADSKLAAPGDLEVTEPSDELVNPAVYVLPKHKKDHVEIAAVQLAIWHYSDGYDFTRSNTEIADQFYPDDFTGSGKDVTIDDIIDRYDVLVASAEADPLPTPDPRITITPEERTGVAGTALFYEVEGKDIDGGISVDTNKSAIKVHPADGDECDTDKVLSKLPDAGEDVCVFSDEVASVTITAKGKSADTTTHALYAYGAQGVITTGPEKAEDTAKGSWTAKPTPPPVPPETEVVPVRQPAAVVPEELPATGPAQVRTMAAIAVLSIVAGAALLVATRRRELEPVAVVADDAAETGPAAGPLTRLSERWLYTDQLLIELVRENVPLRRRRHRRRQ